MMRSFPITTDKIRQSRMAYTIAGVILAILGLGAIFAPAMTGQAIERIVGWLLLLGGLTAGVMTWFSGREGWKAWLGFGGALAAAAAGALLLWAPVGGGDMLTSVLVGFFAASGLAKVAIAVAQRTSIPVIWPWLLASGILDIVLAVAVLTRFPFNAGWFLGLMLGVSMLCSGVLILWIAYSGGSRHAA
ncbi:DUF308 domain-containing protein [Devosia sp. ZB163]|uniref:HdeD family acid-resistance protein n=1 Tax=Devosia sp. ZB163 TaxID=3025938 RepID=UPI0023628144|nr:DUF308 domain-containing protein [Devosia sp. ZB163]MDC9822313.1 DUF308 domain-containing protein [Devosia sp. ZB163]